MIWNGRIKMAYRPPVVKKSDLKGIAKVTFRTDHSQAKVKFADPEVYPKDIVFDADDLPAGLKSGEWFITINSEKTEVRNWRPANALVKAKVKNFVAKKDSKPTPMTHPTYGNRYFQVVFEITEPEEFKGCTVPNSYQYFFTEVYDEDSGKSLVGLEDHPKSKYMKPLVDFLDATGVWEKGSIAYSDNILPTLERRIRNAGKTVMFVIKDGWVDNASFSTPEKKTPKEEPDLDEGESEGDAGEKETTEENLSWE